MPRSHKPRKRYVPKRADHFAIAGNTIVRARTRQCTAPLDDTQLRDLAIGYHGALDSMRRGAATGDDFTTLALGANVALVLCELGLGEEWIDKVKQGQDALVCLQARSAKLRGRYVLTGGELQALQAMLELHDAQLASPDCTQGMLSACLVEITRRMHAGDVLEAQAA